MQPDSINISSNPFLSCKLERLEMGAVLFIRLCVTKKHLDAMSMSMSSRTNKIHSIDGQT